MVIRLWEDYGLGCEIACQRIGSFGISAPGLQRLTLQWATKNQFCMLSRLAFLKLRGCRILPHVSPAVCHSHLLPVTHFMSTPDRAPRR
jgi:hypothetical protein